MLRKILSLFLLAALVGCGLSPQQKYDVAVKRLERAQARLDNLRPAYDAAREKAMLTVCKEIAGTTPEESALSALSQLQGATDQALSGLTTDGQTAEGSEGPKLPTSADEAIDQLLDSHKAMQEQQKAVTGPIAKAYETMNKIKTPGTPEAARFEEVLAEMPEVKAYLRQEKRVESAQQAVDEAEDALPESDRAQAG